MKNFMLAAFAAVMFVSNVSPSFAVGPAGLAAPAPRKNAHLESAKPTLAPYAFVTFCVAHGEECQEETASRKLVLTPLLMRELFTVNLQVNREITPQNDAPGHDDWNIDVSRGDCEDYALTKRSRLAKLGWPVNKLRMAVVLTPNRVGHAVLVVSAESGDLVLDNRTNEIRNWRDTDFVWLKIQSDTNPLFWNDLQRTK
ncbi:putative transglutaminase-like cysteine proteinase [Neorhizobium galegae]|uniref:transglutaminase-like cysteine peptidase n=1 Tax=Neorhizobium galegae TaxID=399 RepID=UPI001AE8EEE4|nr:transglutaminase-like cysteine peptidase [Neorhizobium galegae]MBP2547971.1 putative transglutaminase-like cysteine proteinase [Neorhizobium galegae]